MVPPRVQMNADLLATACALAARFSCPSVSISVLVAGNRWQIAQATSVQGQYPQKLQQKPKSTALVSCQPRFVLLCAHDGEVYNFLFTAGATYYSSSNGASKCTP